MSDTKYTYAVARIRALEVSLFSSSTIEQLIACKDMESCLRFLSEHGWGGVDTAMDADAILTREQEKIWETMDQINPEATDRLRQDLLAGLVRHASPKVVSGGYRVAAAVLGFN